jgi:hypothetical protein
MRAKTPDLAKIEESYRLLVKDKADADKLEFSIYCFPQTWGSACLGFGGIGQSVITTAYTTVVVPADKTLPCAVYFGGKLAYAITEPAKVFFEDLHLFRMKSVRGSACYIPPSIPEEQGAAEC